MKIPFISGEGPDGYLPVNLYFSPKKIYGRNALVGRPGLLEWTDLGSSASVRAMTINGDYLYAVSGESVYKIDSLGNSTTIGSVHRSGDVWMEGNGSQVGIVAGNKFYVYDGDETEEVELSFSPGSLAFEGSYFLAHAAGTENFYESSVFDGKDWNETDFAITSVKPDKLKGVFSVNGNIHAFGPLSGEIYYNSGGSSFAFSKVPGGNVPCGVLAVKSTAVFMGTLSLLNNEKVVVQSGSSPVRLSNEHIDREVENMARASDAIGFSFTMSGHSFYVLTFPYGNKTFVYDFTTKFWYEWRTGEGRWRPNCYVKYSGKHLVGDYTNGKIYELSQTTYADDGDSITFQRTMPVQKDNNLITFSSFELENESGVGLDTGQGSDPQAILEYSTDKGKTWSDERWASIGKRGKYKDRVIWRKLGRHRHFTVRVTVTDPVKIVWTGAYVNS